MALAGMAEVQSVTTRPVPACGISHVSLIVIPALAGVASFLIVEAEKLVTAVLLGKLVIP